MSVPNVKVPNSRSFTPTHHQQAISEIYNSMPDRITVGGYSFSPKLNLAMYNATPDVITEMYQQNKKNFPWEQILHIIATASNERNWEKLTSAMHFFEQFCPKDHFVFLLAYRDILYVPKIYKQALDIAADQGKWDVLRSRLLNKSLYVDDAVILKAARAGQWGIVKMYVPSIGMVDLNQNLIDILHLAIIADQQDIITMLPVYTSYQMSELLNNPLLKSIVRIGQNNIHCQSLLNDLPPLDQVFCRYVWRKQWDRVKPLCQDRSLSERGPKCIEALKAIGRLTDQTSKIDTFIMQETIAQYFREHPPTSRDEVQKYILDTHGVQCTTEEAEGWLRRFQRSALYDILD